MANKVLIGLGIGLVAFLGFLAAKPNHFIYSRSDVIQAPVETVFPFLNSPRLITKWSPFGGRAPRLRYTFYGPDSGPGSGMDFEGGGDAAQVGRSEIMRTVPQSEVELQLTMKEPRTAIYSIRYQLAPEGKASRITLSMSGNAGLRDWLADFFFDLEHRVGGELEKSIQNLKDITQRNLSSTK